jgi:hypothetical protein
MRKALLFVFVCVLLAPALAFGSRSAPGDGSLVVTDANAQLTISGQGLIYGHIDSGTLTVVGDYKPNNNNSLSTVTGAKQTIVGRNVVYTGSDVRFYFPGGKYNLIVSGTGIDLSAVGKGTVSSVGFGLTEDGSFSLDSGKSRSADATGTYTFGKVATAAGLAIQASSSSKGSR